LLLAVEKRDRNHIRVINLSLGPLFFTQPFSEYDPINLATKRAYENGIVVVVIAGNDGPRNDTMNAWAVAPWVIGVGATDDNKMLADYSSRGDPNNTLCAPTVVASGVDYMENPFRPGTSFAAPKVLRIACTCMEFIDTIRDHIDYPESTVTYGKPHTATFIDSGADFSKLPVGTSSAYGSRARCLEKETCEKILKILDFLDNHTKY
jgi:subtilisin family serine protease